MRRILFNAGASTAGIMSVYMLIRYTVGLRYWSIYALLAALLVTRKPFGEIALAYIMLCMLSYSLGQPIEANHYLSFVLFTLVAAALSSLISELRHADTT